MKLIILILICTNVFGAIFEQGFVSSAKIQAHKIYRQDIKFNNNFAEIPKIVLSVIGYHSNYNTLDFFSRVTEVTKEGFQLQVISDSEINEIKFNYLATEHKDVQTICNNIEVQKDQVDIKFNSEFEEQPQVAAFLTGIHRKSQDDIFLEIKSIEKNQVHLTTQSKAESSLGLCLLIGPQDVFTRKQLPIMQISEGLPNTCFYGISSLNGIAENGILLNLNQESVQNSFQIGLTLVEFNPQHITKLDEIIDNNRDYLKYLVNNFNSQEQQEHKDIVGNEGNLEINSIQLNKEDLSQRQQINSISFIYPKQQDQLYIDDEEFSLQQTQENVKEIMTISETWLQHDLSVIDESDSLNNQQVQINEGQQLLTNLIKPEDYNTNSIEQEDFQSFNRQPENIAIVDSTQIIIEENQIKTQNQQELTSENSISIDSNLDYDVANKIEQQIEFEKEQTVVEDLQEKIVEMQQEMQNLQQNSQSHTPSELDPFKIIEQQQFIVEQQKQLVEQQQQIILQYKKLFEDQVMLESDEQPKIEINEMKVQEQQISEFSNSEQDQLQSNLNIDEKIEQNLQANQNQDANQFQDRLEQSIYDEKQVLQDLPNVNLEDKSHLEKVQESLDKTSLKKEKINEQKATKLLKELTQDLKRDFSLDQKINQLEDSLNEVLQIKSKDEVEPNLSNQISGVISNKRVEFSNSQNNLNKISNLNLQNIDNQVENLSFEEIHEAIFPQEYEMEQAYFDWSMNSGILKNRNDQQINSELIQQSAISNQQRQEELQKQIEEFLELDSNESHFSDPLFDDFHSFFSVNQQVKNNLRKRKVLNV